MVNSSQVIATVASDLAASATADLTWWTEAELYAELGRILEHVSSRVALYSQRTQKAIGTTVTLSPWHVSLLDAAVGYQSLEPIALDELEALSAGWAAETTMELVRHYALDVTPGSIRLYPAPSGLADPVWLIERVCPVRPSSASPLVDIPLPLADILELRTLAAARKREGAASMEEVAKPALDIAGVLMEAAINYYGQSQAA